MLQPETRDALFTWYHGYVFTFARDGVLLPAMKKLKYDHSLRVADIARTIADESRWLLSDVILAEVCGLYHDIGRYRQFREHKTFQDHRSINHAECGCLVMEETGCLGKLEEHDRTIIMEATRLHNRKELPTELTPELERFARLVRDADKLDIFHVMYDAVANNKLHDYPEITHGVDLIAPPSEAILYQALRHEKINYSDAHSLADFLLIQMQWAFELDFSASYRMMYQKQVISKLRSLLPSSPQIDDIAEAASAHIMQKMLR